MTDTNLIQTVPAPLPNHSDHELRSFIARIGDQRPAIPNTGDMTCSVPTVDTCDVDNAVCLRDNNTHLQFGIIKQRTQTHCVIAMYPVAACINPRLADL